MKFLQVNLHHAKGASAVLSRRFKKDALDMVLIQEPWSNKGKILGIQMQSGKLYYDNTQGSPRTAILVNKAVKCYPVTEFIKRDIVAVMVEVPTTRGSAELIVASAYFPGDVTEAPPPEIASFVKFCRDNNKAFIIGCDANAHHTVWGSTDINSRGEGLLEFLSSNNVDICNNGNKATFVNAIREEVLDLTLCSPTISDKIVNWHVSDETSLSDHKHIVFEWVGGKTLRATYRDPKKTNWDQYVQHLQTAITTSPSRIETVSELESASALLNETIINAYNRSCPIKQSSSSRDVPWWNKKLEGLRKNSRRLFNKAKRTSDWTEYRRALTEYNNEIRKSKRRSWVQMCESIDSTPIVSRLQKTLSKDHSNDLGNLKRCDGSFTNGPRDTLDLMMETHFPGSVVKVDSANSEGRSRSMQTSETSNRVDNTALELVDEIFTRARVENAVRSFQPFKSAGVDGIIPAMLQNGEAILIPSLIEIFKASLRLNHIPTKWRLVRAIFIPKPGKRDKTHPKAFRPISLTSVLLKTMEKVLSEFINSTYMQAHPLSKFQFAYQSGKSTVTALHTLVTKVEKSLSVKEIALCSFLDIEGAFDNTSYSSMARAMKKKNFHTCIVNWIHTMLAKREITSELGGSSITVRATKGCPQGGVLSPLMWSLVVDDLLRSLEAKGFEVVGFADDIVILVRGKFDNVVSERMQQALNLTHSWCIKEGLSINPSKVVIVPFTKRRKFNLESLRLGSVEIQLSDQVKYLGVILDAKLNWNAHLDAAINKAVNTFWLCSKTLGRKWGLKPKMMMWIYTSIIRPKLTYASLVWWPKTKEATAETKLAKLQRLVCIAITGAMRSTPSKALDAILNLLPLHEHVQLEAERSALRLKRSKNLLPGDLVGHMSILEYFKRGPVMNMNGDWMKPVDNYDIPYKVCEMSRIVWEVGVPDVRQGSVIFYTDGSKIGTQTGAGVFGPGINISVAMGHWPTVFQAEIFAILECANVCLRRKYKYANICIFSDSQAALKALCAYKCTSKIVWECILSLRQLCQMNSVNLYWVPGHCGIEGNERADDLAKVGSNLQFIGPEPFCGISNCTINMELKCWQEQKVITNWLAVKRCSQSKRFITPNVSHTKKLLELNKRALCTYTGLVTGHCPSRYHLKNIGRVQNDICRFCNMASETSEHLLCRCSALYTRRSRFLGSGCLQPKEIWSLNPGKVIRFMDHILPDWEHVDATITNHS